MVMLMVKKILILCLKVLIISYLLMSLGNYNMLKKMKLLNMMFIVMCFGFLMLGIVLYILIVKGFF